MTIGIYLLKFSGTNKVYVGQSLVIKERFTKHKYKLKNNLANYKLQNAFNHYGFPILEILVECDENDDLDLLENEAIEIFDSVNNGFNINTKASGGGTGLQGETHGNSKYTSIVIKEVFKQLLLDIPFKDISNTTGVKISTIRDISKGKSHKWLAEIYPEEYQLLKDLKYTRVYNSAEHKGIIYPRIKNSEGTIFLVKNITSFAKEHGLNKSHLCGVLNGKRKTHLGWQLIE
jgi:group I intron endonuclease